ncbi:MAG: DsbA family protein [Candidatus Hydrothermarchaeales archaeon]
MGRKKRAKKKKEIVEVEEKKGINPVLIVGGLLLLAVVFFFFKGSPNDDGTQPTFQPPSNVPGEYVQVTTLPDPSASGQVHMMVFFDFFCPHCYTFDTGPLPQLEAKYGEKLQVVPIGYPIFGAKAKNALRAYELAKESGKGEEMKSAIFVAYHDQRRDISDTAVLAEIAGEVGLDAQQFKSSLDAGAKNEIVQLNIDLANKYGLKQTPTVVLAGQYVVTDISPTNIETILSGLLA